MKVTKKLARAFTLIEMLFVIVIVAVLMLYAVNIERSHREDRIVQQATTQMLQIMQAARVYYMTKSYVWPTSMSDLIGQSPMYMPTNFQCEPFLDNRNVTGGPPCYNRAVYTIAPTSGADVISTPVLLGITANNVPANLSQKLAAQLPNYTFSNNNTSVTVFTPIPGNVSNMQGFIQYSGMTADTGTIGLGRCPLGMTSHVIFVPQNQTTYNTGDTTGEKNYAFWLGLQNPSSHSFESNVVENGEVGLNFVAGSQGNTAYWNYENGLMTYAYYMVLCLPANHWHPDYAFTPQDAQCSETWSEWNYPGQNTANHNCTCTKDTSASNNAYKCTIG